MPRARTDSRRFHLILHQPSSERADGYSDRMMYFKKKSFVRCIGAYMHEPQCKDARRFWRCVLHSYKSDLFISIASSRLVNVLNQMFLLRKSNVPNKSQSDISHQILSRSTDLLWFILVSSASVVCCNAHDDMFKFIESLAHVAVQLALVKSSFLQHNTSKSLARNEWPRLQDLNFLTCKANG